MSEELFEPSDFNTFGLDCHDDFAGTLAPASTAGLEHAVNQHSATTTPTATTCRRAGRDRRKSMPHLPGSASFGASRLDEQSDSPSLHPQGDQVGGLGADGVLVKARRRQFLAALGAGLVPGAVFGEVPAPLMPKMEPAAEWRASRDLLHRALSYRVRRRLGESHAQ